MLRGSLPPVKQQWFNLYGGGLVHMGCPTLVPLIELPLPPSISIFSRYGSGDDFANLSLAALAALTWTVASRANLYPITIPSEYTVRFFRWRSGTAVVGNFDIGIYDRNFSLLRSIGSTAHPGADTFFSIAITPLTLQPGSYWLAFVADNVGFGVIARSAPGAGSLLTAGILGAVGAFPLPATITTGTNPIALGIPLSIANAGI